MGLAFWPPVSTSAFSIQPSAFALSALLTTGYDCLMDKMPKFSRFFPGRIFLRISKLPFKLAPGSNDTQPCLVFRDF
jgi:hypothetical protein